MLQTGKLSHTKVMLRWRIQLKGFGYSASAATLERFAQGVRCLLSSSLVETLQRYRRL